MKRKRTAFITIANIAAVLLVVCGTTIDGSMLASTSYREAFTPVYKVTSRAAALQEDYPASGAASVVSTATDAVAEGEWPMAAANPQRTSWTPEEVRGRLQPEWYRPIEPYIPAKVQLVAAHGLVYVSTAAGLYALDAATGAETWVYPTDLPLGHSPTVYGDRIYVGGFDHKIHAIDALTGAGIWTFEAAPDGIGAGFSTNPLVVELDGSIMVYAGNRDGSMYAIRDDGAQPALAWSFPTGGPVLLSAAYEDGNLYFASNDSHAYALKALTGEQVWRSAKLPTAGFHSWWPVVAEGVVVFPATRPYRYLIPPQVDYRSDLLTNQDSGYSTPMGSILPDGTMDATQALQYFEATPWRRVYYLLDALTGQEVTFDFDQDGSPEYAPFMKVGTHSGTVYPPVIAADGTIFTFNKYAADKYDQGPAGWPLGSESIVPTTGMTAHDEPLAFSIGGDVIYWNQCCDRTAGAYALDTEEKWIYFSYSLSTLCPGYDVMTMGTYEANAVQVYGGWNGVYGSHGDQNSPVPYAGKVYMHRGNAVIAWSPEGGATALPLAERPQTTTSERDVGLGILRSRLEQEVRNILDAGHLRPGLGAHGAFCLAARGSAGDNLCDYWHSPVDTILALSLAVPHLSPAIQQEVLVYLREEIDRYMGYTHVGWREGGAREAFDVPPEIEADLPSWPATKWSTWDFDGWTGSDVKWVPHTFYALWKYAQVVGDQTTARQLFDTYKSRLWQPPADDVLAIYPFAHNAWIAGHWGYLELERLAGYPESAAVRMELDRLLALRVSNFEKDNPWGPDSHNWAQALAVARNFMFMTPELGVYLHDHIFEEVGEALAEYTSVAPYWFVTLFEASYNENVIQHLYDYHSLFAARAYIFREPGDELVKYLDVPAVGVGDLFYIQNLVAAIEASRDLEKAATPSFAYQSSPVTYTLSFLGTGNTLTLTDTLPLGVGAPDSFELEGTSVTPTYDSGQHRLVWSDTPPVGQEVAIRYTAAITTSDCQALVNTAELSEAGGEPSTATTTVIANPQLIYLPLILRDN